MTLRSCRLRADRPGSGNWTMSRWTTTCGAAGFSVPARSPVRRSASTKVMRCASAPGGRRVSRPMTCSTPGSLARRVATRAPSGLDTPVMSTRRGVTDRSGRSGAGAAGGRALGGGAAPVGGRRGCGALGLRPRGGFQVRDALLEGRDLLAQRLQLVGRRRAQLLQDLADAGGCADELVGEVGGALLDRCSTAGGGPEGPFDGGAQLL